MTRLSSTLKWRWPVLLPVWMALLAGCVKGSSLSSATKGKETFRIGIWDVIKLAPGDFTPASVDVFLYDPLNYLVTSKLPPGSAPNIAAESLEFSPDGKQVIYKLRKGMLFHNGQEVTAKDVAFSLGDDILSHKLKYISPVAVAVLDKYTVRMTAEKAIDWSEVFEISLLSADYAARMSAVGANEYVPMGSGPYKFKKYDKARQILTLERFDNYWAGPAKYKDIEIHHFDNLDAQTLAFLEGKIDFLENVSGPAVPLMRENQSIHMAQTGMSWLGCIMVNRLRHSLRDSSVRRGLSLLIDRKALVAAEDMAGLKGAATDNLFNMAPPYTPPSVSEGYSVSQAEKMFRQAGCTHKGRRIFCGGEPLKVEVIAIAEDYSRSFTPLRMVVAAWNEYGVSASIRILPLNEAQILILKGDFDMVFSYAAERRNLGHISKYFMCRDDTFCFDGMMYKPLYDTYIQAVLSAAGEDAGLGAKLALQRATRESAHYIPLYSVEDHSAVWGDDFYSKTFQMDPALLGYQARPGLVP